MADDQTQSSFPLPKNAQAASFGLPDMGRSGLHRLAVARPVAVTMVVLAFVVFGLASLGDLPLALMPNLNYPTLTIRASYPGAAPHEVEESVAEPIEDRIGNVPGLIRRTSVSRAEAANVVLEFAWGTNMLDAAAQVAESLDRVRLDERIERPQLLRYDPAQDPIMRLVLYLGRDGGVSGPGNAAGNAGDLASLRAYAEDVIRPELSKLPGVAAVRVSGGLERQIRVLPDERLLKQYGLSLETLAQRIRAASVDVSAGVALLGGREVLLRVVNTYTAKDVIENLEIQTQGEGRVRLGELATVAFAAKDPEDVTRFAGAATNFSSREGILLEVLKEGDANIIDAADAVRERLFGSFGAKMASGAAYPAREERDRLASETALAAHATGSSGAKPDGTGEAESFDREKEFGLLDRLPETFHLALLSDQSEFIKAALAEVRQALLLGGLLAVAIVFLFLGSFKATLLIAISIPLSVVATFIPMKIAGLSLNLMSLGGLALGVGMLVDNSIVVLEAIAQRRERGENARDSAINGSAEVGGAIFASTLTTIAVFFPIVFVEGMAGQIFGPLSLTIVFSLLASLIVAQLVVPAYAAIEPRAGSCRRFGARARNVPSMLRMARWPGPWWRNVVFCVPYALNSLAVFILFLVVGSLALLVALAGLAAGLAQRVFALVARIAVWPVLLLWRGWWSAFTRVFPRLLDAALAKPILTLGTAAAAALGSALLAAGLTTELIPTMNERDIYVDTALAEGTPLTDSDRTALAVLEEAAAPESFRAGVAGVLTQVGGGEDVRGQSAAPNRVRYVLTLHSANPEVSDRATGALRTAIERNLAFIEPPVLSRPTLLTLREPVSVEVRGEDLQLLNEVAARAAARMGALRRADGEPLLRDVRSSSERGRPQIPVKLDRVKLERYGLTSERVANELRLKIGGEAVSDFELSHERIDVFLSLAEEASASLAKLADMEVASGIRLKDVLAPGTRLEIVEGPARILRSGKERVVEVTAEPNGVALGEVRQALASALSGPEFFTPEARTLLAGQQEELERSTSSLLEALLLAIFLVYVVMAVQFESFIDPLLVMGTLPLAAVGVVALLWASDMPVSVVVMLGLIVLAGIVVNNAIILVDFAGKLRAAGRSVDAAVREAAAARLRPIAITTLTTVLGLLPMTGWLAVPVGWLARLAADAPVLGGVLTAIAGGGDGAEVRAPMAITVIVGLISSTLLTLIVIPTLYHVVHGRRDVRAA